jgi:DNA-binding transcriptional LysR family regulator
MAAPPPALERSVTLNQLRTFKSVAERLSFSAAALELRLSQPTVSYQVKELEAALGLPLLDRLGKRVQLTEAGQLLYDYARRTLNLLDEAAVALGQLRGLERGSLRVGASTTVGVYVIPHALGAFKRSHGALAISLEIGNRGQVQEAVLRNQLDVAVVGPPLSDPDLAVLPFLTDEIVLVAPAGHPLSGRRGLSLRDLQGQAFIMREAGSSTRWELDKAARRERVELNVAMELGSNGAIKHAVEGGLGLCALSRYAIELERSSGGLVVLDVTGFPLRRRWHIVHLRRRRLPAAVAGFVELLRTPGWLPQVPRS